MKKILLIHGFEGSSEGNFLPWLEEELTKAGFQVINETLPNPDRPNFEESMEFLREKVKDFSHEDSIVGHSLGGYWALKLAEEKEFGGLYLVAPAIGNLPYDWYRQESSDSDIDSLEGVVGRGFRGDAVKAGHKVAFFSLDDPHVPFSDIAPLLDETWEIEKHDGYGHFLDSAYGFILERILRDNH